MENITNLTTPEKGEKIVQKDVEIMPGEAMSEIIAIGQQLRMNPYNEEGDVVKGILQKLQDGNISPDEAVQRAKALQTSRSSHYR